MAADLKAEAERLARLECPDPNPCDCAVRCVMVRDAILAALLAVEARVWREAAEMLPFDGLLGPCTGLAEEFRQRAEQIERGEG